MMADSAADDEAAAEAAPAAPAGKRQQRPRVDVKREHLSKAEAVLAKLEAEAKCLRITADRTRLGPTKDERLAAAEAKEAAVAAQQAKVTKFKSELELLQTRAAAKEAKMTARAAKAEERTFSREAIRTVVRLRLNYKHVAANRSHN